MFVYVTIVGLACVAACIGVVLGKRAAEVFTSDTRVIRVIAGIGGLSGVIVTITLAYIFELV